MMFFPEVNNKCYEIKKYKIYSEDINIIDK